MNRSYPSFLKPIIGFLNRHIPVVDLFCNFLVWRSNKYNEYLIRKYAKVHKSVQIGEFCAIDRNVEIGENTYINSYSQIFAGNDSKVTIGKNCAIGYNVHIKARTHNKYKATGADEQKHEVVEKNIVIGSNVWIGDNAFIREGVTLGDNTIIGANSVVTKSFKDNLIIAGVPANIIKEINQD